MLYFFNKKKAPNGPKRSPAIKNSCLNSFKKIVHVMFIPDFEIKLLCNYLD